MNMNSRLNIKFEWKSMGFSAYVPFIVTLMLILYSNIYKELEYVIRSLEYFFPVFAAWWSILLFRDILEECGSETILSYPINRWMLGTAKIGIFFVVYILIMLLMLFVLHQSLSLNTILSLAIQLGVESFFFAGLGFLAMIMTSTSNWAIAVIFIYSSTNILTKGKLFPYINIYLFNSYLLPISQILPWAVIVSIYGAILWISAQYLLGKYCDFK